MKTATCCAVLLALPLAAWAQSDGIGAVTATPNPAKAGQEVTITIAASGEAPTFCGMVVHFDDGSESRNVKIDGNEAKFPVTISKTFAKPGTYKLRAEGKKITTHFPCVGRTDYQLVVEGAPPPATPACPQGWKMAGKPGKAGDYTCKGGKKSAKPAAPLACAGGTEYFANDKARQIGCRKAKK